MTARHNYPAYRHGLPDDELEDLTAQAIGTHPMLWGAMISIEAHDRIVTLTGIVRTPLNRTLAELLARRQGALGVDNRLQVASDDAAHHDFGDAVLE